MTSGGAIAPRIPPEAKVQSILNPVARVLSAVSTLALWLAGVAMVAMTLIVGAQVVFRYALNSSLVWSEPVSVLLMGWFIFLGSAVGTREGFHLSFDLIGHIVPPRVRAGMESVSDLVVLVFGAAMAVYGFQLGAAAWGSRMPAIGLPDGVSMIPVVLGGILVTLFSLERLLRRAAGLETASTSVAHQKISEV
jgi:TRAP-type C4-dicarboxylate transport system permease small subunit